MIAVNQEPKDVAVVIVEPCKVEGTHVEVGAVLVLKAEDAMCLAGSGRARLASADELAEASKPRAPAKAPAK